MTPRSARARTLSRTSGGHGDAARATSSPAVVLAGMAAVALAVGCGPSSDSLRWTGEADSSFGAAIPDIPSGESFTFGGIVMCVTTEEVATITEISPVDGQNLEVVGFATGDAHGQMFGAELLDLRSAGFDPASRTVGEPCTNRGTELALELRRGSVEPGTGEGFVVRYESPSGPGQTEVPFHVRLCPAETLDTGCAPG